MSHQSEIRAIRNLVAYRGGFCYAHSQRAFKDKGRWHIAVTPGLPDLYIQFPSRRLVFWMEVKTGVGRLRPAQAEFKAASDAAGVPVVVGDLEHLIAFLNSRGIECH